MPDNKPLQVAWDSTVIIDCLQKKEDRYQWIRPLVQDAEAEKLKIVVSSFSVAEAFKVDGVEPPEDMRLIQEFFDFTWVRSEGSGIPVMEKARDLRRQFNIDGIDAVHVATAVYTNTPFFLTNDGEGRKKKTPLLPLDNQIPIEGGYLRVMTPKQYHDMRVIEANPIFDVQADKTNNEQAKENQSE